MMENEINVAQIDKGQAELFRDYLSEEGKAVLDRPKCSVFGAFTRDNESQNELLVGVLLVEISSNDQNVRVICIAVTPSMQRMGVGSALMDHLIGESMKAGFMELQVFLDADAKGETDYDGFFWRCGFSPIAIYPSILISIGDLRRTKTFREIEHLGKNFPTVMRLEYADSYTRKKLATRMAEEVGYYDFLTETHHETFSMIYHKDNEPEGCLLVEEMADYYMIQSLFVSKECNDKYAAYKMILQAINMAEEACGSDTMVYFSGVQKPVQKLIEYFRNDDIPDENISQWTLPFTVAEDIGHKSGKMPDRNNLPSESETNRFSENGFEPVKNDDLQCADCLYRLESNGDCHKFNLKPSPVLYGGDCSMYRKEGARV